MDISAGLIGKIAAGGTAAAATTTAGVIYGEDIYEAFFGESKSVINGEGVIDQPQSEAINWKNSLGLPAFTLSENNNTPTNISLTTDQLKTINFEGKTATELTVKGGGNIALEIKKVNNDNDNHGNYKFIFKNDNDDGAISVGNNNDTPLFTLRKDMNLEFKVKNANNKWSLEKIWNDDEIKNKIGLDCKANNECSLSGGKIIIKQGDKKSNEIFTLTIPATSKIKLQRDAKGYDQGLRFNIEGGDIALTDAGNNINKLEKNESYQIKQDGDKWLLLRRNTALEGLNEKIRRLGIPNECKFTNLTTPIECNDLDKDKLKKIKFNGGNVTNLNSASEKFKLKIEKDTLNADVFDVENLRFSFTVFPVDVTFPQSGGKTITLKKGTNPEFKIKEKDGNWSLERAWDINKLAGKIGLSCNTSGDKKCTLKSNEKINVFKDTGNYVTGADISSGDKSKKITYEEGAENYNQGFKFTVEEDIDLDESGASKEGVVGKIEKEESSSPITYEIKEQSVSGSNKWFLSKVTSTRT